MSEADDVSPIWAPVQAALDRAQSDGRRVDVWLRDDDAVCATDALERLAALSEAYALPVLLAVIPEPADQTLADFIARRPLLRPTQHGFSHTNYAAPDERARELGGARSLSAILDDLARGRDKLASLFGSDTDRILVPPWNRIDAGILPHLAGIGFDALSTFASENCGLVRLDLVNSNLDIIDWRNGRRCHTHRKLAGKLAVLIDAGRPIGLLTHHLVHDQAAWIALELMLEALASHPAVRFASVAQLRGRQAFAPNTGGPRQ